MERGFYNQATQGEGMVQDLLEILKTYKLKYYRDMVEACINGMLDEQVFDKLTALQQRTLIIFGAHDALIPNKIIHNTTTQKIAEAGVAQIRNATLKMIPDAGHFVQWEKSAEVNNYMHSFLQER